LKTVLVTGCAGFIGSHLCLSLLEDGIKVIGIDNFDPYYDETIKEQNLAHFIQHPSFHFHVVDILDAAVLASVFDLYEVDQIVHLAAKAGVRPSLEQPLIYEKYNVGGTINMLEVAARKNIRHFTLASSSSVYGNDFGEKAVESLTKLSPISPYAASKKSAEMYAHSYYVNYGINVNVLRFFTVYGPRQRPDMAFMKFARAISNNELIYLYGGLKMGRDFTYIDDIIRGVRAALEYSNGYEIINLGSSRKVCVMDVIQLIAREMGKEARVEIIEQQPGDPDFTHADISKAQALLNFRSTIPIEEGIVRFVRWYQSV